MRKKRTNWIYIHVSNKYECTIRIWAQQQQTRESERKKIDSVSTSDIMTERQKCNNNIVENEIFVVAMLNIRMSRRYDGKFFWWILFYENLSS